MNHLLIITVLLLTAAKHASEEPEVCTLIRRKYAKTASVRAQFEQSIYWSVREKTSKNRGTIILAPGNRFRIEMANETYVGDGSVYWQYSRRNNQVVIRSFEELTPSTHPSHLLTAFFNDYRFSETGRSGGQVKLSWMDDSTEVRNFRAITLTVKVPQGVVKSITATDNNMNVHTYRFTKTVFGKAMPSNTFTFQVPLHATVIDHRQ